MTASEPSDENGRKDVEEDAENRQAENEHKREREARKQRADKLGLKDWIALIVAALQTIFLPLLGLIAVLIILALIITLLF